MKATLLPLALICLFAPFENAVSAQGSESLTQVAERALSKGIDAKLNAGFARVLGLKAAQPLALKRLQFEKDGSTHILNVLQSDPATIVLAERRQSLTTFYLTDRTGKLKKAVVNDATIVNGGLTNLTQATATAGFNRQKQLWLTQKQH